MKYLFLTAFIFFLLNTNVNAEIRFVSKTGTSKPPYTSWATAADSIRGVLRACNAGDTIIVANGVYKETFTVDKPVTILGSSRDSTIIDSRGLIGDVDSLITVFYRANLTIKNITFISNFDNKTSHTILYSWNAARLIIDNCLLKNALYGINVFNSSSIIKNTFFINITERSISMAFSRPDCHPEISNCLFNVTNNFSVIENNFGGAPVIRNNIIIIGNSPNIYGSGMTISATDSCKVLNNIVLGGQQGSYSFGKSYGSFYFYNNISGYKELYSTGPSIKLQTGNTIKIRNNIIFNNDMGMWTSLEGLDSDYNLFWNNGIDVMGNLLKGPHDITADPMFVSDSFANKGILDYHLQKYSPAIDAGDPELTDPDGSRSDIGAYGGMFGESYTYRDLAPREPVNLTLKQEKRKIILEWNKNSETDFEKYLVYMDTIPGFRADSAKLIAKLTDTIYTYITSRISNYYFKLRSIDKQGNLSTVSEEVSYLITGVEKWEAKVNDYTLFQNYPNPFNPSTKIGFKLTRRGHVRLSVYDIKGELITELVNRNQEAGYYEEVFTMGKTQKEYSKIEMLASGIYFYKIEITDEKGISVFSQAKKMLVIK